MPACCNLSRLGDIKSCESHAFRFLLRKRRNYLSKSAVYYRNGSLQNSPELKSKVSHSTGCDAPRECFQWLHQNWLDSTPAAWYAQGPLPFGHECDSVGWHRGCHLHTNSPGMPPQLWSTLRVVFRFPVDSHVQCDLVSSLWKGSVGVGGLCLLVPPVSHSAWVLACIWAASSPSGQRTQRGPPYWQ